METFNGHSYTKVERHARRVSRKMLVDAGFLMERHDPREVHHVDGFSTNVSLDNLVAVNECWHHVFHDGKCTKKSQDVSAEAEEKFPSFGFIDSKPVPIQQWLDFHRKK